MLRETGKMRGLQAMLPISQKPLTLFPRRRLSRELLHGMTEQLDSPKARLRLVRALEELRRDSGRIILSFHGVGSVSVLGRSDCLKSCTGWRVNHGKD